MPENTPIDANGWDVVSSPKVSPTPIQAEGWTPTNHPTLPPVPLTRVNDSPILKIEQESIPMSALKDVGNVVGGTAGMINQGIMQWVNTLYPGKENTIYKMGKALYDEYKAGNIAETEFNAAINLLRPMWEDVKAVAEPLSEGEIRKAGEVIARRPLTYAMDLATVANPLKAGVKGGSSAVFGPSMKNIASRVARSGEIKAARPYSVIAQDVPLAMTELDNKIKLASKEAISTLSNNPADGYPASKIVDILDKAKNKIGKVVSDADVNAIDALDRYKKRISKAFAKENISPAETKSIIQKLDKDIEWDTPKSDTVNNAIKGLRHDIDQVLKTDNPEYAAKMEPLKNLVELHQDASQALGTRRIGGEYLVNKTVESKLSNLHKGALKETDKAILNKLAEETGYDLIGEAENYRIKEVFDKPTTNGARRAVIGGAVGMAVGGAAGYPKAGAAIGSAIGGGLDVYGGKMLGAAIDTAGTPLRVTAEAIQKINPAIGLVTIQRGLAQEKADHPEIPEEYLPNLVKDELIKDPHFYDK